MNNQYFANSTFLASMLWENLNIRPVITVLSKRIRITIELIKIATAIIMVHLFLLTRKNVVKSCYKQSIVGFDGAHLPETLD